MIEITLLEQLDAFERAGTLSGAAELLHTSQPALTRSMKKLEEELGVTIFERKKNHLGLNETGKVAVEYARRVLTADREMEQRVVDYDRSLHTIRIGFCAPIPQNVLTPILNNLFQGMTISADMKSDRDFLPELQKGRYQLAVTHRKPDADVFAFAKIGQEKLFLTVPSSNPLAFYPEVRLKDLSGMTMLLLNRIGFWMDLVNENIENPRFIIQYEQASFDELTRLSEVPIFTSSYYLKRGGHVPGRIDIPIADPVCLADYYLVCKKEARRQYEKLFRAVNEKTVE